MTVSKWFLSDVITLTMLSYLGPSICETTFLEFFPQYFKVCAHIWHVYFSVRHFGWSRLLWRVVRLRSKTEIRVVDRLTPCSQQCAWACPLLNNSQLCNKQHTSNLGCCLLSARKNAKTDAPEQLLDKDHTKRFSMQTRYHIQPRRKTAREKACITSSFLRLESSYSQSQGSTTFSLLQAALRLLLWITVASEFKMFLFFLHCSCSASTQSL